MKPNYYFAFGCLLLSACHTIAPTPIVTRVYNPPVLEPLEPSALAIGGIDDLNELLIYQRTARQLNSADLVKAIADLNLQTKRPKTLIENAILYASLRGNGDLLRAQNLLGQSLKSTDPEAELYKPLAAMLNATYGEWRRQDDSIDKLTQQVHDGQKRLDQLNEKLDALKNIERTLPARPGVAAQPASILAPPAGGNQ